MRWIAEIWFIWPLLQILISAVNSGLYAHYGQSNNLFHDWSFIVPILVILSWFTWILIIISVVVKIIDYIVEKLKEE